MKECLKCKIEKSKEEFGKDKSTKDGLTRWCRSCKNTNQLETQRRYRETHPEKYTPEHMRKWHLNHAYGISPEQFDEMLAAQGGRCAACPATTQFHIDHDHACCPGTRSCGKCIRGILCRNCNVALGLVDDDAERLERLMNYLKESR